MNTDDYRNLIIEMVNSLDIKDNKFLIQLYTIIKHHTDKRRRR